MKSPDLEIARARRHDQLWTTALRPGMPQRFVDPLDQSGTLISLEAFLVQLPDGASNENQHQSD